MSFSLAFSLFVVTAIFVIVAVIAIDIFLPPLSCKKCGSNKIEQIRFVSGGVSRWCESCRYYWYTNPEGEVTEEHPNSRVGH